MHQAETQQQSLERTAAGIGLLVNAHKTGYISHPSPKLSKFDEPDMRDTAGEVRTNSLATYFYGPLHIGEQRKDNQEEPIHKSFVPM